MALAGGAGEVNSRFTGLFFMTQPILSVCTATCAELP